MSSYEIGSRLCSSDRWTFSFFFKKNGESSVDFGSFNEGKFSNPKKDTSNKKENGRAWFDICYYFLL